MKKRLFLLLIAGIYIAISCCSAKNSPDKGTVTISKAKYEALKRKQANKNYIVLSRGEYDSLLLENENLKKEKIELYLKLLPYIPSGGTDTSRTKSGTNF